MMQVNEAVDLFRALSDLARRYQFRNRDEVCCYGLTVSQCYALELMSRDGRMTSSTLAAKLGLDLSSTTRLIDQLVRKKLALRRRSSDDARVKEIEITPAGERLVGRVEDDFSRVLSQALSDFPAEVRAALPEMLRRMTTVLTECCMEEIIPAGTISLKRA